MIFIWFKTDLVSQLDLDFFNNFSNNFTVIQFVFNAFYIRNFSLFLTYIYTDSDIINLFIYS